MDDKIILIAQRIKALRDIFEYSTKEVSEMLEISESEYINKENGLEDFSFTFLYKCAQIFRVDIVEILTGESPKLSFYSVVRKGEGLPLQRRAGFKYMHMGYLFEHKLCEPFVVTAPYKEEEQDKEIALSYHKGQELNFVLSGRMKMSMEGHIEELGEGDCILYDSGHGHGMIAIDGKECTFLSVILKD